jgi:hypothetical protein
VGVRTSSLLLLFPLSPLGPPSCSTRRTGAGARTEDSGGYLAASCLGCGGCLYGEDGGGGLGALSWGFPWVCKLRVSSEDGGGAHAASLCGFPRVLKLRVSSEDGGGARAASLWGSPRIRERRRSSEDGGGVNAASAGLCLLWLRLFEHVQAARAVVVTPPPRALLLVGAVPVVATVVSRGSSEDGGGGLTASSWGFPCVREWRPPSEDGGGAIAASAGLYLLWLGLFEGGGGHLAASCCFPWGSWPRRRGIVAVPSWAPARSCPGCCPSHLARHEQFVERGWRGSVCG